ncbi:hypothetical protein A2801_04030 [Candidatus Woesebacteria bacterium RIFCSPHIGHO2_01_FULL_41_10]|uniref:thioredoxin-dependent peroxiredoxin n=1 Tax=Candidatus Woesebacteria bacterium RIFCSPHIGHO2_01_FULL_41_10 TaxID=1802500 RepID=A0A1F7YNW2_9BACT|nr:MAG: hypothetical protein A2801_04030 [Candidatus Woesebacteria bacterium RIFCSPHIGHO2_01_FULL_41_10]
MLSIGDKAPDFHAQDQDGRQRQLHDFQGKWLLLYIYPKDFTPGCTSEACDLRDNFNELRKYVQIIGISPDTVDSHHNFSRKYKLPFSLVADPDRIIIKAYGAAQSIITKRISFLVNPYGDIAKIYHTVNPEKHAEEVLSDLINLQNLESEAVR